jgi:hypothetical protein
MNELLITPYSQSHRHEEPKLKGESAEDYDKRTWRSHLNLADRGGQKDLVVIPAHGVQKALVAAAKYSKRQIPGQGKATWTQKFKSGILLLEDPSLGVTADAAQMIAIQADANGKPGSGSSRVTRRFPIFNEWTSTFEVYILDPIITEEVFREMVELAGMFVGLGRFRPELSGGSGGRFRIGNLGWTDNRPLEEVRK